MINRTALLSDLQALLKRLEADLLERSESVEIPDVGQTLRAEYERAKKAERTAQNYEDWRSDAITQAAAAWVLSCVFVRFLEDNRLIDPPKFAGPEQRLQQARDEHELYFREQPTETDREYLLHVFDELAKLPGTRDVFGEHNPVRELPNWLSGDAAGDLLRFFQKIDANTGNLVHDFTDPEWDTRFLGDLYQELSEAARKKYALLQTPEFVEEFILDRTLDPALDEFGLDAPSVIRPYGQDPTPRGFRMIDPACGSGHFLLGAFRRILDRWQREQPGKKIRELVIRTFASINGVDLNPYAVAISRFRLLLAAMHACGIRRLADAPPFEIRVACGDALLHGPDTAVQETLQGFIGERHAYWGEDLSLLRQILQPRHYHAVVANPPYITPKDKALNHAYRERYSTCHRKYSLAAPFIQRIYTLSTDGGFTGQITANSFMKREFGKKLIEDFFPRIDLTHLIDTSLAFIPGHGIPTVILLGRQRRATSLTVRCAMGISREDSEPAVPATGLVWTAITNQIDCPGSESAFLTVDDVPRERLGKHPWSLSGGGAAELKLSVDNSSCQKLAGLVNCVGFGAILGEDDAFSDPANSIRMRRLPNIYRRPVVEGEFVRDWSLTWQSEAVYPYDENVRLRSDPCIESVLWPMRTLLWGRFDFSKRTYRDAGRCYWEYHQIPRERNLTRYAIVFSTVSTHNHFVFDRGGKVFKQSSLIAKLKQDGSNAAFLELVGLLNSSTACFWMRQVFHDKGGGGIGGGIAAEGWERFIAFDGTKLRQFPIPRGSVESSSKRLDSLGWHLNDCSPAALACKVAPTAKGLAALREEWTTTLTKLVGQQEELDWHCYTLYGLVDKDLTFSDEVPPIRLGQRAFEIVLARKMTRGEVQTTWFERHGSTPITEIPTDWPDDYRKLVMRRIDVIESNPQIALIEQPEYKRRWNTEPWDSQVERALKSWLFDRLESYFDFDGRMSEGLTQRREGAKEEDQREKLSAFAPLREISLYSIARLADEASRDEQFLEVGEIYRDDAAFDVERLVEELIGGEHVPLLPILRYKAPGLRKRIEWEKTWELQREEDRLAEERAAAQKVIENEKKRIKSSFSQEASQLKSQRAELLQLCRRLSSFSQSEVEPIDEECEPEIHARVLLDNYTFALDAGVLLAEVKNLQEQVERADWNLDKRVREISKDDPAYQAAIKASESIPDNPEIPVPPKYKSSDFISSGGARYWALRGKLDVPKERWVSFPHCEGPDGKLVIAWAGYDHLQLARAISAYFVDIQERLGGRDDPRLVPLLACIIELLPWLKQWHNDVDPEFGVPMGDYFEGFVQDEARQMGMTPDEVRAWQPPTRTTGRRQRKATT